MGSSRPAEPCRRGRGSKFGTRPNAVVRSRTLRLRGKVLGSGGLQFLGSLPTRASTVTNQPEKVSLGDLDNESDNEVSDPHIPALGLHSELTNHVLINR